MNYHLERGRLLLNQNRYVEAETEFKQALAQNPQESFAMALLAECYLESSRYAEGLELAQKAISLQPENIFLYYTLAKAYFQNKKIKEARQTIQEGLSLDPLVHQFYLLLAGIEFYQEDWKAALQAADRGLELDTENVDLFNIRAQALIKLNRQSEAAETLDYALHEAPENTYAHANKGWVAIEKDQYEEAIAHFKEALRLDPTNEYARSGLKEAIKAKNLLYRYILKYFLWINKMNERGRWFFIIGIYVLYRILLGIAESYPALGAFLYPLIIAYIVMAFSSWIAMPVSNLFLRLHPVGKYALSDDEIKGSNVVGLLGLGAILSLGGYLWSGFVLLLFTGAYLALLLIPVGGLFSVNAKGKARRSLSLYTGGLAVVGLAGVVGIVPAIYIFLIGIFAYSFVANYLMQRDAKEFR